MRRYAALLLFSLVAFHCGGAAASPQPPACLGVGSCIGRGQGGALLLPLSLLDNRSILLLEGFS